MNTRKLLAVMLAAVLVICAIPFTAFAADPTVQVIDGERTVFVSSFGRLSYEGKAQTAFKSFPDAFNALGVEGGTIIFAGNGVFTEFNDIKGRKPIRIVGVGTKATGNVLDFTKAGPEVVLEGDLVLEFLNLRLAKDAFLFTNGFAVTTRNGFDTYNTEQYVANGPNIIRYPDPPSVAAGEIKSGISSVALSAGTYTTLAAGSVNGHPVNANTYVSLGGGTVENVVAGNIGNGTMTGNARLTVGNGIITNLIAGSMGGVINGNVTTVIDGGEIASAVIGAQSGATINGNVVVALNGGTFAGQITAGTGTVTGKKIVITGADASLNLASGAADYVIKISGGLCEPQFNGTELTGFLITDTYGIPATTATINGAAQSSETGSYSFATGTTTVGVETKVELKINKYAKYVAGYTDGTFLPQNNMTRAEAITLLTRIITDENNIKGKVAANYEDVEAGAWYESYIGLFQKLGVLTKLEILGGGGIAPTQNITRAEFVELIYGISGLGTPATSAKVTIFSDVKATNKHAAAISYAVSEGYVTGYEDETFRPENNITRAEVVTIVNRVLGRTPTGTGTGVSFSDIESHWAKGQILAANGNENETWTSSAAKEYVPTGSNNAERIKALYEQSKVLNGEAIRNGIDVVSAQLKNDILNSPNTQEVYGDSITQVYYVSEKNGSDENDGKTPETAFKTHAGARNKLRFPKKGTAILYERGGIYRGQVPLFTGAIYGSYGTGSKPLFMQSSKNYADPELWVETEWPNIWRCAEKLINVGVIGFDHDLFDYSDAAYNETYGLIMNKNMYGFMEPSQLNGDLQFYSELLGDNTGARGDLYLYSANGNPGSRFKSIEIGEKVNIIAGGVSNITVDNIAFKFTGAHAVGFGTTTNLRVTNCIFSWIGGSILSTNFHGNGSPVNYGNAVEIYGGCDGYHVENNWMYQIYDTAVTHQRSSSTGDCYQGNINYLSNLMEYCFWGIEFYNAPPTAEQLNGKPDNYKRLTENVYSAYNILRKNGYGWGSITRYRTARSYCGSTLSDTKNNLTEYNIFDRAQGYLLTLPANATGETQDKNIYVQHTGQPLGSLRGKYAVCSFEAAHAIKEDWGDKNAVVIVIDSEKEPVVLDKPEGLAKI